MSAHTTSDPDIARAYAECESIARAHDENFPTASRLLPADLRRHLGAFYAFARAADDWADEPDQGDLSARRAALRAWRARLYAPAGGSPVHVALAESRRRLGLGPELFERLLDAFERDLAQSSYDTWDDLLTYCRDSAEPVGRLVLWAAGDRDPARAGLSDRLCTALQLTNFWQDLSRDEPRGRRYLPARERAAYGDARALAYAVARTRRLFDDAAPLPGRAPRPIRTWLHAVHAGGRAVLERVAALGPRAFTERAALSGGDKAKITLAAFAPDLPLSSFGASFLLLDPTRREALAALHAFCRALDDEVDDAPTPELAMLGLARVHAEIERVLAGDARSPAGARMAAAWPRLEGKATRESLLAEGLALLARGLTHDARGREIATDDDLERYCAAVGGGPGLAALPVFGRPDARAFANALGVALQRTNILRDVAEDARAGRVYLPSEDLARAGLAVADLAGEFAPPGYRRVAEPLVERARVAFDRARAAVPTGATRALAPALAMGKVYEGVLARIAQDPTRVWRERVHAGALERAWRVAIAPWAPPGRARSRRAGP